MNSAEVKKPKLYNWVRIIKNISLFSAIFTTIVMLLAVAVFILSNIETHTNTYPYSLLATLLSSLLLTIGIRKILLRTIIEKFQTRFSFELILASWCIMLILIHLQCQLVCLMQSQAPFNSPMPYLAFILATSVIYLTWPRLSSIQSLLQNQKL